MKAGGKREKTKGRRKRTGRQGHCRIRVPTGEGEKEAGGEGIQEEGVEQARRGAEGRGAGGVTQAAHC